MFASGSPRISVAVLSEDRLFSDALGQFLSDQRDFTVTAYDPAAEPSLSRLSISEATVKVHLSRIFQKLDQPARDAELERHIAEYERKLREQLLHEHEIAELAAQQREMIRTKRFLPIINSPGVSDAVVSN